MPTTDKIVSLYMKGLKRSEIARQFGVTVAAISWHLKKIGVPNGKPGRPETVKQNDRFHNLYDLGCNDMEISRETGVPHWNVTYWRRKNNLPGRG